MLFRVLFLCRIGCNKLLDVVKLAMSKPLRSNDIVEMGEVEHIRHRPEIHIGSTKEEVIRTYFYQNDKLVFGDIPIIPGVVKLFDEAISNSIDESIRTKHKYANKIRVKFEGGVITVEDNGRGLPIEKTISGDLWTPEIIVTKLRTSSNFDDAERTTIGLNGVGISLVNIFSEYFSVTTENGANYYKQEFEKSLTKIYKPTIKPAKDHYTEIKFKPDYDYFKITPDGMKALVILIEKRIRNLAFVFPEITFHWNGNKINTSNLDGYLKNIHPVYEMEETSAARLGVFCSEDEFKHISFVNGAETIRGGTHMEYISGLITDHIREYIKKKYKFDVKPIEIKSKLFIVLSIRINNPRFDSQTKERLVSNVSEYKALFDELISKKFLSNILKNEEIIEPIVETYRIKAEAKENIELRNELKKQKKKVAKLVEAISRDPSKNTIFIVEGDSALSSLINVRNNFTAGLPLRGKIPNVYDMKPLDVMQNAELSSIVNSIGLKFTDDKDKLNYNQIAIMTDADIDGNSITGLLLSFFYKFWPELFDQNKIIKILSPLYIAIGQDKTHRFYTKEEWHKWSEGKDLSKFKIKYNKGLGSLTEDEYEIMINQPRFVEFKIDNRTGEFLEIAYGDDSDKRKVWLSEVKN